MCVCRLQKAKLQKTHFFNLCSLVYSGESTAYLSIYIYIYIYTSGHLPLRAYLSSLLVEGVNSTLCALFLQVPENTVKYSVYVGVLPSI